MTRFIGLTLDSSSKFRMNVIKYQDEEQWSLEKIYT